MIETYDIRRPFWHGFRLIAILLVLVVVILFTSFWWLKRPPADFPINSPVTIPRGLSASAIANLLEEHNVVRSEFWLYVELLWRHDPSNIQAGTFVFQEKLNVSQVAERIATTPGADSLLIVTLPEGYTIEEFAGIASLSLPDFDTAKFRELSKDKEGYMFPETFYLPLDFSAEELYELQLATYEEKTADISEAIKAHPLGERGVLTLASLLEREANSEESMRIVSGILQKRLDESMRLQVDASLEYVLDRPLNTLSSEDLEIDSPYNTYLYDGLPPTPIGNPGLIAIKAVLYPEQSDYYYYLTDDEGIFRYAETFDEHRYNIAKYLQ